MSRKQPLRKQVIWIVVIMSIVLYLAGVFSGLYANKIYEDRAASSLLSFKSDTQKDIVSLEERTAMQITSLNSYIKFLETNLNTLQLQQEFTSSLPPDKVCRFSDITTNYLTKELAFYRERLPYRLEEYEKENELSDEYLLLKQQYNMLSLRTWVLVRNQRCEPDVVQALYLYSSDCEYCVEQGEELDAFTRDLEEEGKKVMLFTIDYNADDPLSSFIKEYYSINSTPAIIIGEQVYQGELFDAARLEKETENTAGVDS